MSRYRSKKHVERAEGMCLDDTHGGAIWVCIRYEEIIHAGVKQCKSTVEVWTKDKTLRLAASGICGVNAKRHYDRLNNYYFG